MTAPPEAGLGWRRIRLDSRKSVRSFKGIICVDISEFAYMPSHAVGPLYVNKFALIWAARKPAYIRERRVQTVALEIHELAIAVALLHSVETINTLTAQASIATF
jgi:hypothetical protein